MDILRQQGRKFDPSELGHALIRLVENNLPLREWNFLPTLSNFNKASNLKAIYDSEYCRVKFMLSPQQLPKWDELTIQYGRLHAPSEAPFMTWEGEHCRCWHHIHHLIRFLDGFSSAQAVEYEQIHGPLSQVAERFWNSDLGKKLREEYPPQFAVVQHSILWKHYGPRLFEVLDLRRPDLWTQYQKFIKEYYRLLDMKASYGPPYENVC